MEELKKGEWSLKGKELYAFDDELMDKVEAENLAKDMEVEIIKLFETRHIEILRQKIVEDAQTLQDKVIARVTSYLTFPLKSDPETLKVVREVSAIINEEFREYKKRLEHRFNGSNHSLEEFIDMEEDKNE